MPHHFHVACKLCGFSCPTPRICLPLSPLCLNPVAASASIEIWSDPLHCKLCGFPRPKPRICPPFSPLCLNPGCFGLSFSRYRRSGLVRSRGRYGRSNVGSHPPPRKWKLRRWRASAKKGGPVIKEPEMGRHMPWRRRKNKTKQCFLQAIIVMPNME